MSRTAILKSILAGTAAALVAGGVHAESFNIPAGDLSSALDAYSAQTGISLMVSSDAVRGLRTHGVKGDLNANDALSRILTGTGFTTRRYSTDSVALIRDGGQQSQVVFDLPMQLAQAAPAKTAVETVTVTSSKLGGADVQSIPIAITALSQEQLTATQTTGGPDLVKQVPNLTFTKTNFAGYSIQIRGIGTQAISVTTDPAVAVALNDIPFIRNHFFEQEFFDLGQAEILRGPQGTLYGRNATAGVVNLTTAKPTDQFEAMGSAEVGNYSERRFEGMLNLPIVDDRLDIRLAGEWTKRNGYSLNELTNERIDGRDLWSGRLSIGFKPVDNLQINFMWEHFSEDDDRLRSGKQLCKNQPTPTQIDGVPIRNDTFVNVYGNGAYLGQGCEQVSLYSPDAYQVPNGATLPYYIAIVNLGLFGNGKNPYAGSLQNPNLRVIDSQLEPTYRAKNDIIELNTDYNITPDLTFTSQTGFNHDFLYSTEDFNRFVSNPGIFTPNSNGFGGMQNIIDSNGVFCDPQLGCSDRLVAMDLNEEHSWQLSQEFRLASHLPGRFNFSFGGNYLHYETEENYYVFINALSIFAAGGSLDANGKFAQHCTGISGGLGQVVDPNDPRGFLYNCVYMDPNPIGSLNNKGHNYFLNQNPYLLNSYAGFGETYFDITKNLKLTTGLRFTEDQKHFTDIPSELALGGAGYAISDVIDQTWDQFTGRAALNWTPKLNFTDQTLFYGSYAHGYKAGGANPPGALLPSDADLQPTHPLTFKPEFIDAFELGTKNTLLDGALTLNVDAFYYNYENYQISQIVDRTAINFNFDAHVKGAEVEASWEPIPGLRFNASGGWEDAVIAKGSHAIDIMDRTAGNADWIVIKPWPTEASNCIMPTYVIAALIGGGGQIGSGTSVCEQAYNEGIDPAAARAKPGYIGWDPATAPNGGAGFDKDLGGNKLPNSPPLTLSLGAQYSMPLTPNWAGTLRTDYYWQDYSWARVYNDDPYDRLRGYTNVNFSLILTNQSGWQVMGYVKNAFNTTAITGAFLNSDDTLLTTNVFLTDPRLLGIRITKNW